MKYPNERRIQTSVLLSTYNELVAQGYLTADDYITALKEAVVKLRTQNEALQKELSKQQAQPEPEASKWTRTI